MKKLLLGSTALVAASVMLSNAAVAQTKAGPIQMSVGGTFNAWYAFVDQDDDTNRRDHGLFREAEVRFIGSTRLDNGLQVGVRVSLEAEDCLDQIDESWIWFDSQFGRLEIGETDNVGWKMYYGAPTAIPNFSTSVHNAQDWNTPTGITGFTTPFARLSLGNDTNAIAYYTPRIAGFQLGVSYRPENCKEGNVAGGCGGSTRGMLTEAGTMDVLEGAVNYVNKFGDFDVALYGAASTSSNETAGGNDAGEWGGGFSLGFAGFTFGAAYTNKEGTGLTLNEADHYNVGVRYVMGPWGLGLEYGHVEAEAVGGDDEGDFIYAGATYLLGPGITAFGGVTMFDYEDGAGVGGGDGWVARFGTAMAF